VGEAGDEVVTFGVDEHLGFVFEASERLGVKDPVAVALEGGPKLVWLLDSLAAGTCGRLGSGGSEQVVFELLSLLS
jgi:hypothetical protein